MIITLKHELETIFAIFLVTGITLILLMQYKNPKHYVFVPTLPPVVATPTLTPILPTQTTLIQAPDETITLFMKKQPTTHSVMYSFSVAGGPGQDKKLVYTTTVTPVTTLFIPFNTWSPDDKTIFLKKETPTGNEYYVLPVTEDTITNPITIQDKFIATHPQLILTDVTGWAAPNLLIVNTSTRTGKLGPSFWFDIQSQTFIELSNRFN